MVAMISCLQHQDNSQIFVQQEFSNVIVIWEVLGMNFNIHIADDLHKKDKNPSSLHSSISTFQINAERDCINAINIEISEDGKSVVSLEQNVIKINIMRVYSNCRASIFPHFYHCDFLQASNWHEIGTLLLFHRKSISVILCTVKIMHHSRFPMTGNGCFHLERR